MQLIPREIDKLMIVVAADLAKRRKERGLKLNYPEAVALITYEVLEGRKGWKNSCGINGIWNNDFVA